MKKLLGFTGTFAYGRLALSMFIAAQVAFFASQTVGFGAVRLLDLIQNAQWIARDHVSPER